MNAQRDVASPAEIEDSSDQHEAAAGPHDAEHIDRVHTVRQVLADFGSEHRWTRTLTHCERDTEDVRVGTVRSCHLARTLMGRTQVSEAPPAFEPGRVLAYAMDGPAGPFAFASSHWSTRVVSADLKAVTVEGRFETRSRAVRLFAWPLLETFPDSLHAPDR